MTVSEGKSTESLTEVLGQLRSELDRLKDRCRQEKDRIHSTGQSSNNSLLSLKEKSIGGRNPLFGGGTLDSNTGGKFGRRSGLGGTLDSDTGCKFGRRSDDRNRRDDDRIRREDIFTKDDQVIMDCHLEQHLRGELPSDDYNRSKELSKYDGSLLEDISRVEGSRIEEISKIHQNRNDISQSSAMMNQSGMNRSGPDHDNNSDVHNRSITNRSGIRDPREIFKPDHVSFSLRTDPTSRQSGESVAIDGRSAGRRTQPSVRRVRNATSSRGGDKQSSPRCTSNMAMTQPIQPITGSSSSSGILRNQTNTMVNAGRTGGPIDSEISRGRGPMSNVLLNTVGAIHESVKMEVQRATNRPTMSMTTLQTNPSQEARLNVGHANSVGKASVNQNKGNRGNVSQTNSAHPSSVCRSMAGNSNMNSGISVSLNKITSNSNASSKIRGENSRSNATSGGKEPSLQPSLFGVNSNLARTYTSTVPESEEPSLVQVLEDFETLNTNSNVNSNMNSHVKSGDCSLLSVDRKPGESHKDESHRDGDNRDDTQRDEAYVTAIGTNKSQSSQGNVGLGQDEQELISLMNGNSVSMTETRSRSGKKTGLKQSLVDQNLPLDTDYSPSKSVGIVPSLRIPKLSGGPGALSSRGPGAPNGGGTGNIERSHTFGERSHTGGNIDRSNTDSKLTNRSHTDAKSSNLEKPTVSSLQKTSPQKADRKKMIDIKEGVSRLRSDSSPQAAREIATQIGDSLLKNHSSSSVSRNLQKEIVSNHEYVRRPNIARGSTHVAHGGNRPSSARDGVQGNIRPSSARGGAHYGNGFRPKNVPSSSSRPGSVYANSRPTSANRSNGYHWNGRVTGRSKSTDIVRDTVRNARYNAGAAYGGSKSMNAAGFGGSKSIVNRISGSYVPASYFPASSPPTRATAPSATAPSSVGVTPELGGIRSDVVKTTGYASANTTGVTTSTQASSAAVARSTLKIKMQRQDDQVWMKQHENSNPTKSTGSGSKQTVESSSKETVIAEGVNLKEKNDICATEYDVAVDGNLDEESLSPIQKVAVLSPMQKPAVDLSPLQVVALSPSIEKHAVGKEPNLIKEIGNLWNAISDLKEENGVLKQEVQKIYRYTPSSRSNTAVSATMRNRSSPPDGISGPPVFRRAFPTVRRASPTVRRSSPNPLIPRGPSANPSSRGPSAQRRGRSANGIPLRSPHGVPLRSPLGVPGYNGVAVYGGIGIAKGVKTKMNWR